MIRKDEHMKHMASLTVVLLGLSAFLPGCLTAATETYRGITGAQYSYEEVQPAAPARDERTLGEYKRFELGSFTDDMGGKVPRAFFEYLPTQFNIALAKKKLPDEVGGKTLLVRGKVVHYESESLGAVLISPLEEVVARVELVDKQSGKVIGVANCVGRSTARTTMGVESMAQGLSRGIVGWIDSRYPKGGRDEKD
jgi:hypothetical protein